VTTNSPTVNVTAPSEVTGAGNQYYDSGSKTQWFRPSGSGSFALNATASEAHASIDHVTFPDLSSVGDWTGSGGSDATSPYSSPVDYAWSAGASAPGSATVTATNGAGATASDTITMAADSTAPTGQAVAVDGGSYFTSLS